MLGTFDAEFGSSSGRAHVPSMEVRLGAYRERVHVKGLMFLLRRTPLPPAIERQRQGPCATPSACACEAFVHAQVHVDFQLSAMMSSSLAN